MTIAPGFSGIISLIRAFLFAYRTITEESKLSQSASSFSQFIILSVNSHNFCDTLLANSNVFIFLNNRVSVVAAFGISSIENIFFIASAFPKYNKCANRSPPVYTVNMNANKRLYNGIALLTHLSQNKN